MKVYVVIKRQAQDMGDTLETLGVFSKKEDARKSMLEDLREQKYDEDDCVVYDVCDDSIYIVGRLGFSCDHYWVEIAEEEVK